MEQRPAEAGCWGNAWAHKLNRRNTRQDRARRQVNTAEGCGPVRAVLKTQAVGDPQQHQEGVDQEVP